MTTPATTAAWGVGFPDGLDNELGTMDCIFVATIGGSGVGTITRGAGLFNLTRNAAGDYTIGFLAGPCVQVVACEPVVGLFAASTGGVTGAWTTDNGTSTSTPGVGVKAFAAGGVTATEIASGNSLYVRFKIKVAGT